MSEEDILHLVPSPEFKKVKRNRISSPISTSSASNKNEGEIIEMFSIKSAKNKSEGSESRSISDEVNSNKVSAYRDKIKNRFRNIKKRASRASLVSSYSNRSDLERVRNESKSLEEALGKVKSRFDLDRSARISFFCEEPNEEGSNEDTTLVYYKPPEALMLDDEVFLKFEKVDFEKKIEGEPRNLEDEGFHVAEVKVSRRILNLLEQRLFGLDDRKWFNCNGELNIVEDPTTESSVRPYLSKESNLYTRFPQISCNEIIVQKDITLHLELFKLTFNHHPLFSDEHVVENKLKNLFHAYKAYQKSNTLQKIKNKLDALRLARDNVKKSLLESGDASVLLLEKHQEDIRKLQEEMFTQARNERQNLKQILEAWKWVKIIRATNGYASTKTKLIIKKEPVDYLEDKAEMDQLLNDIKSDSDINTYELKKKLEESFRNPGEPKLTLYLTQDKNFEPSNEDNFRINSTKQTKLYIRIICDKVEVLRTRPVSLNDFKIKFNESLVLKLFQLPKVMMLELVEQPPRSFLKKKIEIVLESKSHKINQRAVFLKNEQISFKHSGTGSGFKLSELLEKYKLSCKEDETITTNGCLDYSLYQETGDEEQRKIQVLNKYGAVALEELKDWIGLEKLDPENPKNSNIYEYVSSITEGLEEKDYFRLDPLARSLKFCEFKVLEENLRLKVLELRNSHEIEFDGKCIPNRIREIDTEALSDYRKRIGNDEEDEDFGEELEQARSKARKHLRLLYNSIFQKCKNTEHNLLYEHVVDEKLLGRFEEFIKAMIKNFFNWFKWRPGLPLPLSLKSTKATTFIEDSRIAISIYLRSVKNAPKRNNGEEPQLFWEISFNDFKIQSGISQGTNAIWNETLAIPIDDYNGDYLNPSSLSGVITLNLFDKYEDDTNLWLGTLEIPLSSMSNHTIDDWIMISMPFYSFSHEIIQPNQIFLDVKLNISPNIPILTPSMGELPSNEVPYIQDHILRWNELFNNNYPARKFSALVLDTNGKTVCVTRFLRPLEPPQLNIEGFDVTPDQCCRYLSLIPFTTSNQFYQNILLTTDLFLKLQLGSILDHSTALVCYLEALNLEAYLMLAEGVNGVQSYVLLKAKSYFIYDTVTNSKYEVTDAFCPVKKVFCLINSENVWGNIQRGDEIAFTRFDLGRRSDWTALFDQRIKAPTISANPDVLYRSNNFDLEDELEKKIRKKFNKLRPLERTVWNYNISNYFKNSLKAFELNEMHQKSSSEALNELKQYVKGFKDIYGYVFNMQYKSRASVLARVKDTQVHKHDGINEFVLAVHARQYQGQVLSVWIC